MEKHTCKLCFRGFSNGRALGGHMRSHVTAAPAGGPRVVLPDSSASSFSTSSREEEEEEAGDGKGSGLSYGLRENPRKSFRLVDPEFSSSFPAAVDAGSSVVQDRESDTESPRPPALQRPRSKRTRRGPPPPAPEAAEPGPASSVSDTTPEEDVAISLMMLSRDLWASGPTGNKSGDEAEERRLDGSDDEEEQQQEERIPAGSRRRTQPPPQQQQNRRSRFQCETCKKSFRSYQALGGHRASHKKLKGCAPAAQSRIPDANSSDANADRGGASGSSKAHECPLCFRVFGSGQALGGHKRSHLPASATTTTIASSPSPPPPPSPPSTSPPTTAKYGDCLIDLNLPAPMDDDLAELSVVSDAEFVVRHHPSH